MGAAPAIEIPVLGLVAVNIFYLSVIIYCLSVLTNRQYISKILLMYIVFFEVLSITVNIVNFRGFDSSMKFAGLQADFLV